MYGLFSRKLVHLVTLAKIAKSPLVYNIHPQHFATSVYFPILKPVQKLYLKKIFFNFLFVSFLSFLEFVQSTMGGNTNFWIKLRYKLSICIGLEYISVACSIGNDVLNQAES